MSTSQAGHPSPHRRRVERVALAFGLCGAPLAWAVQLDVNFVIASHSCIRGIGASGAGGGGMLAVNVATLAIAFAALAVAGRTWQTTREEYRGGLGHRQGVGTGRSHFLATCGLMAGAVFFIAIAVNTAALIWAPPCAA